MNHFDIVIKGGTVVNADESVEQDVGIQGSIIAQVGGAMTGDITINAKGKLVLPGGIDPHVHLSSPRNPENMSAQWTDDFFIGSLAAISGGVTTVGNMTFQWPDQSLDQAIVRDATAARDVAAVDYILHPVLTNPTEIDLAKIAEFKTQGIKSMKIFLVADSFELHKDKFIKALRLAAEYNLIVLLHCEDPVILKSALSKLEQDNQLALAYWSESRPVAGEKKAVEDAVALAKLTKACIYIVHLSSGPALDAASKGKEDGIPLYVETRPMYLHLTKEKLKLDDGAKYISAPPLRDSEDAAALWEGLRNGAIDVVGSDHAPFTLEDKLDSSVDVRAARQGVSDLETSLPMLFSRGVVEGRLSINRFVALTSSIPAQIFGIAHKKGGIHQGKDADIVIWDPKAKKVIQAKNMFSKSGYSVYENTEITGLPETSILRGAIVMRDFEVTAITGAGKWVKAL